MNFDQAARAMLGLGCLALTASTAYAHPDEHFPHIMTSPDGMWTATIDDHGQIKDFIEPNLPDGDSIFQSFIYEATSLNHQHSSRVEDNYTWVHVPDNLGPNSASLTLVDHPGLLEITIDITMVDGPSGGALVTLQWKNVGIDPVSVKPFFYMDFDVGGDFSDDEAMVILHPDTDLPRVIEQSDDSAPNPLWVGACPHYDSWEIDTYPHLRTRLDSGVVELADQDLTAGTPQDHTVALSIETVELKPNKTLVMVVGIGGADFDLCPALLCPWDLDASDTVGILDLLALIAQWGADPGGPPDFDGDGIVGLFDMLTLVANWGPCP
ncbi:MAG: hypothetical protein O7C65_05395 [Planctomycetota bacterium]|nr:hypothetical protein [Planctomycetota bacterium]